MYKNRFIQITLVRETGFVDETIVGSDDEFKYGFKNQDNEWVMRTGAITKFEVQNNVVVEKRILPAELRTDFRLKTTKNGESGTVTMYNLSEESVEFLPTPDRGAMIEIDAGYEDNHGIIWSGQVIRIQKQRKQSGDFEVKFTLGQSSTAFKRAEVFIENREDVTPYELIKEQLDKFRIPSVGLERMDCYVPEGDEQNYQYLGFPNYSFIGTMNDFLTHCLDLLKQLRYVESMSTDTETVVVPAGQPTKVLGIGTGTPVIKAGFTEKIGVVHFFWDVTYGDYAFPQEVEVVNISSNTGLIEVPTRMKDSKSKISLKHRLTPDIRSGRLIDIETSERNGRFLSGRYIIHSAVYRGSNYGKDHYVEIEALEERR